MIRRTRFVALCALGASVGLAEEPPSSRAKLDRVAAVHGDAGPWAVAGYRIGERAMKDLGLPRQSFAVHVVHQAPAEVQYSCMADGLQAATGASLGKLNLRLEEARADAMATVVTDRKTGRVLTFTLRPKLRAAISDLPRERFEAESRRIIDLPDDEVFAVVETKAPEADK